MTFREKIDKLLTINENKSLSIQDLEHKSGLGMNTIRRAYNENRDLSRKATVKLLETFHVKRIWWETGEGNIFEEEGKKDLVEESPMEYKTALSYAQLTIESQQDTITILKARIKELEGKLKETKQS